MMSARSKDTDGVSEYMPPAVTDLGTLQELTGTFVGGSHGGSTGGSGDD